MSNRRKMANVKEQERICNIKKAEFQRRKYDEIRREYELKVQQEMKKRQYKKRQVEKLEYIEAALISRLQNTQARQKEAYLNLEDAISRPSMYFDPYAKRQLLSGAEVDFSNQRYMTINEGTPRRGGEDLLGRKVVASSLDYATLD